MKKLIVITFLALCTMGVFAGIKLVSKTSTTDTATPDRTFPVSNPTRTIPTPPETAPRERGATATQTVTAAPPRELLSEQTVQRLIASATDLHDDGIYKLKDEPRYEVFFIAHARYFAVRLKETFSEELLEQVGTYLGTTLDLSQEDLCKLNIDVFASASYDPSQSQDVGLPACPGPRAPSNGR